MRYQNIKIVVVLPAFNEAATIADTIQDFYNNIPDAEIWVVNNRSTDETENVARDKMMLINCKGGVLNEIRPGKGSAVRKAFKTIDADIYILADADSTYPAAQVHELIKPILKMDADMVVGDRRTGGHYSSENKRLMHNFGNELVVKLINVLFNSTLKDVMSGYRVFSASFIKTYPILVDGFELETDMTLHALYNKFNIIEIPVNYKDRPSGSYSKLDTVSDGFKVVLTIFNIFRHYRSLVFFGSLAFLFSFFGFVLSVPVIYDWLEYQYILHVPLAVLCSAIEIVAIILLAIGLILDTIQHQGRRVFEINYLARDNTRR